MKFQVRIPDSSRLTAFGKAVESTFVYLKSLDAQSKVLGDLRDALLPKLMSGEIRVRDAEKVVEEAV